MTTGERIKARRKAMGMSADTLGEVIGKDRSVVFKYERDEVVPPIDVITKMADALKVHPAYLMGWVNNPDVTAKELALMDEPVMWEIMRSSSRLPQTGKAEVRNFVQYLERKPEDGSSRHD